MDAELQTHVAFHLTGRRPAAGLDAIDDRQLQRLLLLRLLDAPFDVAVAWECRLFFNWDGIDVGSIGRERKLDSLAEKLERIVHVNDVPHRPGAIHPADGELLLRA